MKVTFAEPAEDGATESYYDAEHIILAGGSYPAKLPVEGMELEGVLTSDGLFALKEIPESLTIIGGGVIGVEFAEVFSALGCKVTILEALPKLLANLDKDCLLYTSSRQNTTTQYSTGKSAGSLASFPRRDTREKTV